MAEKNAPEMWSSTECAEFLNIKINTWLSYVNRPGKFNPAPRPIRKIGVTPVWDPDEVKEYAKNRFRALKS
jgi:hypothetical protein